MKIHISFFMVIMICINPICTTVSAQSTQRVDSVGINKLPSVPFLPDPLVLDEGGKNVPITNKAQWQKKRHWIKKEYQYWISGRVPPAPKAVHAKTLSDTTKQGVEHRMVELYFGPKDKAKMTVELLIPTGTTGRLPVFMTQWNHRGWAQVAVRRGYIGCVYAGADAKDDTKKYPKLYPGYDWGTLMRRAWGASRVVDYLYELPSVDTSQIALTGHSRNGKQSLMAAAFDHRIDAVISSSGGTGGEMTFRYSDERFDSESLEEITRNFPSWFGPRLRWFMGREQKLPVDQNSLMALIAPRGLMIESAITENQGNPWGIEQSYRSVKRVYHFLGADSSVAILVRGGRHQHSLRDLQRYIDFFDHMFGRGPMNPKDRDYYDYLYYGYSFSKWKRRSGEHVNPLPFSAVPKSHVIDGTSDPSFSARQDSMRRQIRWLLGKAPPEVVNNKPFSSRLDENSTYRVDYLSEVIGEPDLPDSIKKMKFGPYTPLGENLWGTIYFPAGAVKQGSVTKKLPLVIYLHPYSYATGYRKPGESIIQHFTAQGYAVLVFDLIGFGTRIQEARHFYDRYPRWSKMGNMVTNVQNIVSDARRRMSFIDSTNIYLAGYSLGGTVALLTTALDPRIKGMAEVAGFSSLRYDKKETGNFRRYWRTHGLIPRLGFFDKHRNRIPIDFDGVLSCIAPRPLLIIAPERDRNHSIESVQRIVSQVSMVYRNMDKADKLIFKQPDTYNHFTDAMQQQIAEWLKQQKNE